MLGHFPIDGHYETDCKIRWRQRKQLADFPTFPLNANNVHMD